MRTYVNDRVDLNFYTLLEESRTVCEKFDRTREDPKRADVHDLQTFQNRLTEIADQMTVYLPQVEL